MDIRERIATRVARELRDGHYVNLGRTEPRLRRLLRDFRWRTMDEVFLTPEKADTHIHAHQATMRYAG